MTKSDPKIEEFLAIEGWEHEFELQRGSVQPGRTFSVEAMDDLLESLKLYVATRVQRRWEATGEPPTHLNVSVKVDVA